MDVTVIVATFGDRHWAELAEERAIPSAVDQATKVINPHGQSLAAARNMGARLATTEWLCFLDADDELAPGYFDAMAAGTADLRGPAVEYIKPGRDRGKLKVWPVVDLADGNYLVIGTLVRREMFLAVGGFLSWPIYEDWCLWQRCEIAGASIEVLPDAVYRAHVRVDSRNRSPERNDRLHWHNEIRRHNYPQAYEDPAFGRGARKHLHGQEPLIPGRSS